jgi:hypothetical protein
MHDEGLIGKTSDGLYHGLNHRTDIRRFARSLVSLETMLSQHLEAEIEPDDVTQTGESAKQEIPAERLQDSDVVHDEPSPTEWIVEESAEDNEE